MWALNATLLGMLELLNLLYKGTIAVIKEYDIHQNYKTKHSSQYSHLTGKQWPEKK